MPAIARYTGGTIDLTAAHVEKLTARLEGEVLLPGAPAYDEARTVWNAAIDKRPAIIARCANKADVAKAIRFARQHEILISVRCGGHNIAGKSVVEDGLMIDLTPICEVQVDTVSKTADVGGGAALGALDRGTQKFGLGTTAGVVTHKGVGGLIVIDANVEAIDQMLRPIPRMLLADPHAELVATAGLELCQRNSHHWIRVMLVVPLRSRNPR